MDEPHPAIGGVDTDDAPEQVVIALEVRRPATPATGAPPPPTPLMMITMSMDDRGEVPDRVAV